jgi:SAM-dependent methyltransferase
MAEVPRPTLLGRNEYTAKASCERFIVPQLAKAIEDLLHEWLAAAPSRRVLDAGCGGQPFRQTIERLGHGYTGLDVAQNAQGTVDLIWSIDAETVPRAMAGAFDFILCTEVLEHVWDWNTAFRNLRTLLARGGVIVITCPFVFPLHEEPFDYWRPTLHAIRHNAATAGFMIDRIDKLGDGTAVLGTVLGSMNFRPSDHSFSARFVAWVARAAARGASELLEYSPIQARLRTHDWLYLSNVAVLRAHGT